MASMMVQHNVIDYAAWKKVYDSSKDLRTSGGELSDRIYRDASEPNKITLIFKWNSIENAHKFANSPELKATMEKAGVNGAPTINFLNEA